jgi:hypothetical protein
MSLSDAGNHTSDEDLANDDIRLKIRQLRRARVAVVVAAGNHYFEHSGRQGMGYPAIIRESVSVGAVYDADEGAFSYRGGATAFFNPGPARLHPSPEPVTSQPSINKLAPIFCARRAHYLCRDQK